MRFRRITRQKTSFCLVHARISISGKRHTQVLARAHQVNPTGGDPGCRLGARLTSEWGVARSMRCSIHLQPSQLAV